GRHRSGRRPRRPLRSAVLAGALAGLTSAALVPPGPAAAGEGAPADDVELSELRGLVDEPIVSTASQSLESASAAPATSTSISADELRRFGIRSLDEAINYLSLGMVTQNPLHSVEIGARG